MPPKTKTADSSSAAPAMTSDESINNFFAEKSSQYIDGRTLIKYLSDSGVDMLGVDVMDNNTFSPLEILAIVKRTVGLDLGFAIAYTLAVNGFTGDGGFKAEFTYKGTKHSVESAAASLNLRRITNPNDPNKDTQITFGRLTRVFGAAIAQAISSKKATPVMYRKGASYFGCDPKFCFPGAEYCLGVDREEEMYKMLAYQYYIDKREEDQETNAKAGTQKKNEFKWARRMIGVLNTRRASDGDTPLPPLTLDKVKEAYLRVFPEEKVAA